MKPIRMYHAQSGTVYIYKYEEKNNNQLKQKHASLMHFLNQAARIKEIKNVMVKTRDDKALWCRPKIQQPIKLA